MPRERAPNFLPKERDLLRKLIKKYTDVIENKSTHTDDNIRKAEAWRKLTEEFNTITPCHHRSTEQLKNCFRNLKHREVGTKSMEMEDSSETQASTGTEGSKNDSNMEELIWEQDVSAEQQIFILEDSNQEPPIESLQDKEDYMLPLEKSDKPLPELEITDIKEWSKWLKSKQASKITAKREESPSSWKNRRKLRESHDKLLQSKLELVELIKKNTEAEAQMKQEILKEQLKQEKIKTATLQLKLNKIIDM